MTESVEQNQQPKLPDVSLWHVLTNNTEELAAGELVDYIGRLNESPEFRKGEILNLLALLQNVLAHAGEETPGDAVAQLGAGHVVLMAHTLLRRLD